jgi:hypothetical protein
MQKVWESSKNNQLNGAKKIQIRLDATCNKNEQQQQDDKNNGEL